MSANQNRGKARGGTDRHHYKFSLALGLDGDDGRLRVLLSLCRSQRQLVADLVGPPWLVLPADEAAVGEHQFARFASWCSRYRQQSTRPSAESALVHQAIEEDGLASREQRGPVRTR